DDLREGAADAGSDGRLYFVDAGRSPGTGRKRRRESHESQIDFLLRRRRSAASEAVFELGDQLVHLRDSGVAWVVLHEELQGLDGFGVFPKVGLGFAQNQFGDVGRILAIVDRELSLLAGLFLFLLLNVNV